MRMIQNVEIASVFEEIADLLEIQGENLYRVRAYRNAARVIGNWPKNLSDLLKSEGALPKLPAVGKDLDGKIRELITTGRSKFLGELKKQIPEGLLVLLKVPTLGPKRVKALQENLGIRSVEDLQRAARSGKISKVPGFGQKTEKRILDELHKKMQIVRYPLAWAEQIVRPLIERLQSLPGVKSAVIAGSFRRRLETIGDLDLLVVCHNRDQSKRAAQKVMNRFVQFEEVAQVLSHGVTRSTVVLQSGIQVDLRVVPEESAGAALHYFTGSKSHNIAIRSLGVRRGLKINEYGVFKGDHRIAGRVEEEVFAQVGLPYIEPELRENRGEIEAAQKGELPQLITIEDIRGDLHAHTKSTDGRLSVLEMADAAQRRGYEYLAITDHSQHLKVARGLDRKRLLEQIREIDQLNATLKGFRILRGIEVDILENGCLDLPEDVLKELDICVCSIHSHFELSDVKQTERVIRAMDSPYFHILGHPTGRLMGKRLGYAIHLERVMNAARERGCSLEINAQPDRMDLNDLHCRMAKELGVTLVISTDAHSDHDLDYMRFGISVARRGWLSSEEVLNTRSVAELLKLLRRS